MESMPDDKGIQLKDILEDGFVDREKAHCLDANYFKGGNLKSYFEKHRRQLVFSKDGLCHVGDADIKGNDTIKRVYHPDGKAPTLTTMGGGHREPKVLCGAWRGRYVLDGVRQDHKQKVAGLTTQRLEVRQDGKTNALTTVQKDNVAVNVDELKWRKLTPLECERLQTVPDGYTNHVSNTQRYRMLGNGWTVDVVAHIFDGMKGE
jgi:site-specific DNA-cytosine methylase